MFAVETVKTFALWLAWAKCIIPFPSPHCCPCTHQQLLSCGACCRTPVSSETRCSHHFRTQFLHQEIRGVWSIRKINLTNCGILRDTGIEILDLPQKFCQLKGHWFKFSKGSHGAENETFQSQAMKVRDVGPCRAKVGRGPQRFLLDKQKIMKNIFP